MRRFALTIALVLSSTAGAVYATDLDPASLQPGMTRERLVAA